MRTAISIFGSDRPGIIAELTKKLTINGANIEDASMTLLQGNFAMILVVDFRNNLSEDVETLLKNDPELNGLNIFFSTEVNAKQQPALQELETVRYIFHLSVKDALGVVARVTELLAAHNSNVVNCATRKNNNTDVFTMVLDVDLPLSDEEKIVEDLSQVSQDFNGDVIFQRVDDIDL